MSDSQRFKGLEREVGRLRGIFLPPVFNSLGSYPLPERVQAHTRAFVVLCHGELESYFEDWAKAIVRSAEVIWNKFNRTTLPMTFLMSFLDERQSMTPSLGITNGDEHGQSHAKKMFVTYYKFIKDNNGIKARNVLALLSPLGVPSKLFGSTLLPDLDTLGATRGKHAHQSAKAVAETLDPENEYKRIIKLLADLRPVDQWLAKYKRGLR